MHVKKLFILLCFALFTSVLAIGAVFVDSLFLNKSATEETALLLGRSVAYLCEKTNVADRAVVADYVARLTQNFPLPELKILIKRQFFVHTDPKLDQHKLDISNLEDKIFYDKSQKIQKTMRHNVEEKAHNPAMAYKAFAEVEKEWQLFHGRKALTISTPVSIDGNFKGIVDATLYADPVSLNPAWTLLFGAIGLTIFLLFWILSRLWPKSFKLHGSLLFVVFFAVFISSILIASSYSRLELEEARVQNLARVLDTYKSLDPTVNVANLLGSIDYTFKKTVDIPSPDIAKVEETLLTESGHPALQSLWQQYFRWHYPVLQKYSVPYLFTFGPALAARLPVNDHIWQRLALVGGVLFLIPLFLLFGLGYVEKLIFIIRTNVVAYLYIMFAMVGMIMLVFIPFLYGIGLGFFRKIFNVYYFVGFENFTDILSNFNITQPLNFYFTLGVTVLWTVTNVSLHVTIGLAMAMLLKDKLLKFKGIYRVLLILPWAVPNFITALIWSGMFHKQFGTVNHLLAFFGIEPIAWYQTFGTAFLTNLITNTWLGFPFMMVISLGALQSIPDELYEAADVDGASRMSKFFRITLPLLKTALFPAIILGTIWTFNMFNIVWLVSMGRPGNSTDILITQAYRWAFEADQYGYAAAYSTVIFLILLVYTLITNRVTHATKGVFD
jgi:ABC-type sugar transport system permease subunit